MVTKYYVEDDETAFMVVEESEFFRLKILRSEIDEDDVEDFLDTTVEWLSSNPSKGILIDFSGVRSVCPGFTVELQRNFEEIKSQGLYVRFVNVDPTVEPYIDVQNITVVMNIYPDKPVLSAKQILSDLANNLTDEDLMKKHSLSPKGLRSMYKKLLRKGLLSKHVLSRRVAAQPAETQQIKGDEAPKQVLASPETPQNEDVEAKKPSVNAWDVLKDIEKDISDDELMHKYRLSPKGLESLMRKLVDKGLVTSQMLSRRRSRQA